MAVAWLESLRHSERLRDGFRRRFGGVGVVVIAGTCEILHQIAIFKSLLVRSLLPFPLRLLPEPVFPDEHGRAQKDDALNAQLESLLVVLLAGAQHLL